MSDWTERRVLVVGLGGLACPALWALAEAGVRRWVLMDDDVVDETNLHRQVIYEPQDVGRPKLEAMAHRLVERGVDAREIELVPSRLLPDNARSHVSSVDLVLEGADNYATKFLAADACFLERKPIVHGAAVGWQATAWAVAPRGRPCYRCLFEDVPEGPPRDCNSVGVMGPVVGFAGALMADLALDILKPTAGPRYGTLIAFDGLRDRLRQVSVPARPACPLCSERPRFFDIEEARYCGQTCAA